MTDEVITTGVDELLNLLRSVNKISISEAAHKLGVNASLIQSWVDFLVEEEIVGIEYKFTKPIIYINKAPKENEIKVQEDKSLSLSLYKNEFQERAAQKNIPAQKIGFFWKNHIMEIANSKKEFFLREARKRNLKNIDGLWQDYVNKLLLA